MTDKTQWPAIGHTEQHNVIYRLWHYTVSEILRRKLQKYPFLHTPVSFRGFARTNPLALETVYEIGNKKLLLNGEYYASTFI